MTPTEDGWYWARWNEGDDFVPTMFVDGGSAWKLTPHGTPVAREASKLHEWGARLLAAQVPRPVPEGECPKHYFIEPFSGGSKRVEAYEIGAKFADLDGMAYDEIEARSHVVAHRSAVAADCFPEMAARIEALKAENARLREEALTKDAALSLLGGEHKALVEAHNARVRAAQSTPRPTVDSGAPSGLDTSKPAPGFVVMMQSGWWLLFWRDVATTKWRSQADAIAESHRIYRAESAPAVAAATATLVAERDALAEQVRAVEPLVAAVREHMRWDWLHLLDDTVHSRDVREDVRRIDIALAEYDRLFPAGPRAEREQADGG